jgi:peroxiredoxin/outer membrane lipoprotein-sorting protein
MNRLILVFICFTFSLPANCQDAASIIKKVAERNRALEGYRVEGGAELYRPAAGGNISTTVKFLIEAADRASKLHIEYQNSSFSIVLITDGSTIWTYMPHDKAYTKVQASAIPDMGNEGDDGAQDDNLAMSVYSMAVRRYATLDKVPSQPELAGEEAIKTGDGKVPCWIIKIHVSGRTEKLWVDQQRYLVLRAESNFEQEGTVTRMKIFVKRFDVETPAPTAFTFVPDKRAKLVDELDIPGSNPRFIGKPAADFALKNLDGEPVRLSEFRGKIIVLNFWATWCPPCREELPTFNKLAEQFKDKNVVFLGINDEGAGTVKSFNKKNNYTFVTLEDKNDKVHQAYRATAIPSVFVIRKDGIIATHFVGSRGEDEFMAALQAAGLQ